MTTKLWNTYHRKVDEGLGTSLRDLGLDYIDLYLMHWPISMNPNGNHPLFPKLPDGSRDLDLEWRHTETWKAMEKLPASGKVKAIGVCNYSVRFLKELLATAKIVPAVNQIESHPYLPQEDIVEFSQGKGIVVTAYSPLGGNGSPLFQEEGVQEVAKKHNVTPGTVLISYASMIAPPLSSIIPLTRLVVRGIVVIPKSVTPSRITENMETTALDESDVKLLNEISKKKGVTRYVYPPFGFDFGFPDKQ